jgi:hypothetical protein
LCGERPSHFLRSIPFPPSETGTKHRPVCRSPRRNAAALPLKHLRSKLSHIDALTGAAYREVCKWRKW